MRACPRMTRDAWPGARCSLISLEETKGFQGMGVEGSDWFDGALLPISYRFKLSC